MKTKVLGISASPQKGGKVEVLIQEVLSASGISHEMVRLHELDIKPCRACGGCRGDNVCVINDDWGKLRSKILESDALVIGSWAFSGMIDAATKAFMERFWSFRHHHQLTRGKLGAVVLVGLNPELAGTLGDALLQFMRNNGMNALGRVTAVGANPCLGCDDSLSSCEYSGVVAQYGLLERIGTGMYNPMETQLGALKSARILGQRIGHKIKSVMTRGSAADGI
jgi:multimeric flavodoxin WrbA